MMPESKHDEAQPTTHFSDDIGEWANAFYKSKKAEGLSPRTLAFYWDQLGHFFSFANIHNLQNITQLTPENIRGYLLWLKDDEKHNPGGVHAAYRVLKTFLRWYEMEAEPDGWHNPIHKVKAPKLTEEPLIPVSLANVERMLKTCRTGSPLDVRDYALLLFLLDTGARAREVLAVDLEDINQVTGAVLIRQGKGRKTRTVCLEKKSRRAFKAYQKQRTDKNPAAWITDDGERLGYGGLRAILFRRAKLAVVDVPTPHDFRRAFAVGMLRNGCDIVTLARLMGHRTLKVLQRYLHLMPDDLQTAHHKSSPVEHMRGGDT